MGINRIEERNPVSNKLSFHLTNDILTLQPLEVTNYLGSQSVEGETISDSFSHATLKIAMSMCSLSLMLTQTT